MKILFYKDQKGRDHFSNWLLKLKDQQTEFRIRDRIDRIEEYGFLGDWKRIDERICELRFHFGSGYRIYFSILDSQTILMLCGGDKSSQSKDINKAKQYLEDYQNDSQN